MLIMRAKRQKKRRAVLGDSLWRRTMKQAAQESGRDTIPEGI